MWRQRQVLCGPTANATPLLPKPCPYIVPSVSVTLVYICLISSCVHYHATANTDTVDASTVSVLYVVPSWS